MHQDQRIGLALGVLLIGACAAFFFRNETRERAEIPRLQRAQELDDRIAERATRPYLTGVEAVEAADRARLRTVADRNSDSSEEDHAGSYWSPTEQFGDRKSKDRYTGQNRYGARASDTDSDVMELAPIPVPSDGLSAQNKTQQAEPSGGSLGSDHARLKPTDTSSDPRTHVVQKGETLSSIATKRLGNPNRFHEIFDANQDQLKDANDLRAGMVLQIPGSHGESSSKASSGKTFLAEEPESSNSSDSALLANPHKGSVTSSQDRRSPAPRTQIHETPIDPIEGSSDSKNEVHSEPSPVRESSPSRKFVPARKFTPPGRPIGPQAMLFELFQTDVVR